MGSLTIEDLKKLHELLTHTQLTHDDFDSSSDLFEGDESLAERAVKTAFSSEALAEMIAMTEQAVGYFYLGG